MILWEKLYVYWIWQDAHQIKCILIIVSISVGWVSNKLSSCCLSNFLIRLLCGVASITLKSITLAPPLLGRCHVLFPLTLIWYHCFDFNMIASSNYIDFLISFFFFFFFFFMWYNTLTPSSHHILWVVDLCISVGMKEGKEAKGWK